MIHRLSSMLPNPYAALTVPAPSIANWGSKQSNSGASPVTLSPGWYNNGLTVNSSQHVTLNPGIYYVDGAGGGLTINAGAVVTGTGVTFVLTSSSSKKNTVPAVKINGSATVNVTAPTSNSALGTDSSGVVMFLDPNIAGGQASESLKINGNSNTYFGGAVVAPTAAIHLPARASPAPATIARRSSGTRSRSSATARSRAIAAARASPR